MKTKVWLTETGRHYVKMNELHTPEAQEWFNFGEGYENMGYTAIGEAEMTISFYDASTITKLAVEAIKTEIEEVKASSTAKITSLQEKINQILAITNEVDA